MATRLLSEIPSGILADKWRRKKTLFLSQIFLIINITIVMVSSKFVWFLIAQIFSAFWVAFYSGSAIAFIYDSLKELKMIEKYEQIHGRAILFSAIAGALAASIGGILYSQNAYLPFMATAIFATLSLIIILMFVEPKYYKKKEQSWKMHFMESLRMAFKQDNISYVLVLASMIIFTVSHIFHYAQIYFKEINVPIIFFGFIYAGRKLFGGLGGIISNKIKNKFSYKNIFSGYLVITFIVLFGMALFKNVIGVVLFLISYLLASSFKPIYRDIFIKK